jgi:glucose-1-phosphate adenylyltransferase
VLEDLLLRKDFEDFGSHVIPHAIHHYKVCGFDFDGFWEDIGTIRSFYETNLRLTMPDPPFNLFDDKRPIYTHPRYLPGSTVEDSQLENVLLSEGCCLKNADVRHSIVGLRSQIGSGVRVEDSILMGADYLQFADGKDRENFIPIGIGDGSLIKGAIVDKNAHIGRGVTVLPFPRGTDMDGVNWYVRDGIVVIPKNAVIQNGTYIGPERKLPEVQTPG